MLSLLALKQVHVGLSLLSKWLCFYC